VPGGAEVSVAVHISDVLLWRQHGGIDDLAVQQQRAAQEGRGGGLPRLPGLMGWVCVAACAASRFCFGIADCTHQLSPETGDVLLVDPGEHWAAPHDDVAGVRPARERPPARLTVT
jgi:hypothetical protein